MWSGGTPVAANPCPRPTEADVRLGGGQGPDPCLAPSPAGVEPPGGDRGPRGPVVRGHEVEAFWNAFPSTEMAEPTRIALQLLLVTARRRGEVTRARKWAHFDLDNKLWTIPVQLLKSSHSRRSRPEPHVVPLSPLALDLLRQLKAITGDGAFILPARVDAKKDRPYSDRVLSRAVREAKEIRDCPLHAA